MTPIPSAAAKPPVPTVLSAPVRAKSAEAEPARAARPQAAGDAQADDPVADSRKAARQAAKDQARQRVLQLVERLKTIKKFASENPEVMARQLAQVAKELKAALKAYADAGGSASGWQTSLSPTAPAGPDAEPRDVYQQMKAQVSGSEAAGDMDFLKQAKGVAATIKEFLTKAKILTALKGPDKETQDNFDETDASLKEVAKAIDAMDRDIRASSPAAGMFVAMVA